MVTGYLLVQVLNMTALRFLLCTSLWLLCSAQSEGMFPIAVIGIAGS